MLCCSGERYRAIMALLFSTLKNSIFSITFEKISELDSYFIHEHIIIKYRSSLI